jgi:hypothetical protein
MTFGGVLARLLMCLALVFGTWNPSGYCYLDWVRSSGPLLAEKAVATAALVTLYLLFIRITQSSLGRPGIAATVAVLLTGTFSLSELDLIDLAQPRTRTYLLLTCSALLLATGLLWSLFKERVLGQSNYLNPPP